MNNKSPVSTHSTPQIKRSCICSCPHCEYQPPPGPAAAPPQHHLATRTPPNRGARSVPMLAIYARQDGELPPILQQAYSRGDISQNLYRTAGLAFTSCHCDLFSTRFLRSGPKHRAPMSLRSETRQSTLRLCLVTQSCKVTHL